MKSWKLRAVKFKVFTVIVKSFHSALNKRSPCCLIKYYVRVCRDTWTHWFLSPIYQVDRHCILATPIACQCLPSGSLLVGSRASFPVAVPRIWNALSDETSAQSLTSSHQHLKSRLFRRSYPDLIIWSVLYKPADCISFLTVFNPEAVLHFCYLGSLWVIAWLITVCALNSRYQ